VRNLKLPEWANVAEIFASVVIVISLIYVGFEVNQNTQALQNEVHQNVLSILTDQQHVLVEDAEFLEIFLTAETTPTNLSALEWSRFEQFMYGRFGVWEYLYVAIQNNAITDAVWLSYEPYYLVIICKPGYQLWWQQNRTSHGPDFIAYVDEILAADCE
jgi:hypothetical protein